MRSPNLIATLIVSGFTGLEFVVGDKTLILRDAQHEYVLNARG